MPPKCPETIMLCIPFWFYRYLRHCFYTYIGGDLVQSVGRGKKLVGALAPAEVHAIYRNFIQLDGLIH
jgi:hypothetical protein